ncbi:MAG: GGDEF domain-containing protein [Coriobacteriales bacterium]|jgi:diguanylate cyclase (GGDEF)-like protein|nr:GGDEF domain-containing protein [Coriobacteriales bacterium]
MTDYVKENKQESRSHTDAHDEAYAETGLSMQRNDELLQSVRLFESIAKDIAQWIIVIDCESKEWLYSNHHPTRILHFLSGLEDLERWINNQTDEVEKTGDQSSIEFSLENDDDEQCFLAVWYPVVWRDHKALAFVLTDITEQKIEREKLETIAYYDTLTGSYSRYYGMNLLEKYLRDKEQFIIAFIDMDGLKYVNDTYGHNEGDAYIIAVTQLLKGFDDNGVLCRLGGDEFMLLCKGWSKKEADERLENMRQELAKNRDSRYQRSISYGVVEVTEENENTGSYLLSVADEIMYNDKRERKMERRADL